jgi:hypothetical protein
VQDCLRPEKDNWFSISCERDRIGISKMSYFAAVSPLLRTGARSIAIMAPLIPVFALAHGQHSRSFELARRYGRSEHSSDRNYKVIPAAV